MSSHPQWTSREQEAEHSLKGTTLTRGAAAFTVSFLLLVIFGVPTLQQLLEIRENLSRGHTSTAQVAAPATTAETGRRGDEGTGRPSASRPALPAIAATRPPTASRRVLPQSWDVFALFPSLAQISQVRSFRAAWDLIPPVPRIRDYENALEQHSVLSRFLLPRAQSILAGVFGIGNEQAYCGRREWLVYRPDLDHLTAPGFLDPGVLKNRRRSGVEGSAMVQPDPVEAIIRLHKQLEVRGIELVVVPAPAKPAIEPDVVSARYKVSQSPVLNPSYTPFVSTLEAQGIPVFDAAEALMAARSRSASPVYLETDTHWTPAGMESAARSLADFINRRGLLPSLSPAGFVRRTNAVTNLGDVAVMLKLPEGQRMYRRQTVVNHPVYQPDGTPWAPSRHADVLLLGDSFSNIYSLDGMGWGEHSGLAEQLSYYLQRPLDKIVINAGGAYSSRLALAQELAKGKDRLASKRLVVYEFAMRDLSFGDWKRIDLPAPRHEAGSPTIPPPTSRQPVPPGVASPAPPVKPPGGKSPPQVPGVLLAQAPHSGTPLNSLPGGASRRTEVGPGKTPGGDGQRIGVALNHPTRPSTAGGLLPHTTDVQPGRSIPGQPGTGTTPIPSPPTNSAVLVEGVVKAIASVPRPGTVPYKDCVIGIHLSSVKPIQGKAASDLYIYLWGMRDNKLTDGAGCKIGQSLTLRIRPWDTVEAQYGSYSRSEIDDPNAALLDTYWGEIKY